MIRGSCCCGAIRFELTSPPMMMGTCHCSRCRKAGASTFVFVEPDSLRWLQGSDLIARLEPEPPFQFRRSFCSRCGTALGEPHDPSKSFILAANCLDDDPGLRNHFHEFVADKPAWYEIHDAARQFAGYPVVEAVEAEA